MKDIAIRIMILSIYYQGKRKKLLPSILDNHIYSHKAEIINLEQFTHTCVQLVAFLTLLSMNKHPYHLVNPSRGRY